MLCFAIFLEFCAQVESFQIALLVRHQQGVASSRKVIEFQRYPVTVVVVYIYIYTYRFTWYFERQQRCKNIVLCNGNKLYMCYELVDFFNVGTRYTRNLRANFVGTFVLNELRIIRFDRRCLLQVEQHTLIGQFQFGCCLLATSEADMSR